MDQAKQSQLDQFLGEEASAGERTEDGQFTLNPERAEKIVAQFQDLNENWYWIKLLQAFDLAETSQAEVVITRKALNFRATFAPSSPILDGAKILDSVQRGNFGESALGHLAAGLAGARYSSGGRLELETPQGTLHFQERWVLDPDRCASEPQLRLELAPGWGWFSGISKRATLVAELTNRCCYYSRPLTLDGKEPTRDWTFYKALLAEMYIGGGELGFQRLDLSSYKSVGEDLYLYSDGPLEKRAVAPSSSCTVVAKSMSEPGLRRVLALTNHPESTHELVRHGVVVESVPIGQSLGTMDRMNLGLKGVSECSHLPTDASGLSLVRGDELKTFHREFLEQALELNQVLAANVDITRAAATRKATPDAAWMGKAMWVFHKLGASAFSPKITSARESSLRSILEL